MHLPTLLGECELNSDFVESVRELTELKAHTREMGSGEVPAPIAEFISAEFERAALEFVKVDPARREQAQARSADFFRHHVRG
ncbi:hypothetical protein GCM10027262_71400 [Nocardia tengchongensis]